MLVQERNIVVSVIDLTLSFHTMNKANFVKYLLCSIYHLMYALL